MPHADTQCSVFFLGLMAITHTNFTLTL